MYLLCIKFVLLHLLSVNASVYLEFYCSRILQCTYDHIFIIYAYIHLKFKVLKQQRNCLNDYLISF